MARVVKVIMAASLCTWKYEKVSSTFGFQGMPARENVSIRQPPSPDDLSYFYDKNTKDYAICQVFERDILRAGLKKGELGERGFSWGEGEGKENATSFEVA
jgi:hypothetical protein